MQPRVFSLSREVVRQICPDCAERMAASYIRELKLQVTENGEVLFGDSSALPAETRMKLFTGFSQGLCDKFGGDEGFFTRCAGTMEGKVDDEKGFCAALHKFCVGKWPAEKEHEQESDRLVVLANDNSIREVEIFASGEHNGDKYTEKDLDQMVEAFNELDFRPAIKVGHTKDKPGAPAYGWVTNLKRVGQKLFADLESMHDSVVDAVRNKSYDRVSSEIYFNLKRAGKVFPRALKAVALLGAEVPAVAGLIPLHKMEFSEEGFERVGAFEQELSVSPTAILETLSQRIEGLSTLIKEYDMSKHADTIKALKAQIAEFTGKMEELRKKKGKKPEENMEDDAEYKQLAAQAKAISEKITTLESEDKTATDANFAQLQQDLAESKAREATATKERKELSERLARIEQQERHQRIGERVKVCKIPSFRSGLEAIYAYALEHSDAKVKVFSKDKDDKDISEEKTLADVLDGFVTQINEQSERLFKAMAYSGIKLREDGTQEDDAGKEVQKRVADYRVKHPTVKTYEEAMTAVLKADPELAKKWQSQLGPEQ